MIVAGRHASVGRVKPIAPSDMPLLARNAAEYQRDPASATSYLGTDESTIAAELSDLELPIAGALIGSPHDPTAWIVGEIDPEVGRVWWLGPFTRRPDLADAVYLAAHSQLDPRIAQEELAADRANANLARLALRHGFHAGPASHALNRDAGHPTPEQQSPADIGPASSRDRSTVATLHDRVFPGAHYTGRGLVERTKHHVVVARLGGMVVGYVAAELQPDGSAYIDFLGVDPKARRRGIGRDLVIAVCRWADSQDASHAHLTVRETLPGARQLYESVGFALAATLVPYRKGFTLGSEEDEA